MHRAKIIQGAITNDFRIFIYGGELLIERYSLLLLILYQIVLMPVPMKAKYYPEYIGLYKSKYLYV